MNTTEITVEAPQTPAPEPVAEPVAEELPKRRYGAFNLRMLASTVDICLLFVIALPAVEYMMMQIFPPINARRFVDILNSAQYKNDMGAMWFALFKAMKEQQVFQRMIVQNSMQLGLIGIYILPFWMRYSSTPGKMLFRLTIVDDKTGEPMSDRQAVVRFFGYIVSGALLSLGFVWIALNKKRRGFHDFIAGTVVILKPKSKG